MSITANFLMEVNGKFGIDSIDSNPNFNFLSKISDNDNDDELLFNNPDFSPYSELEFNCSYIGPDHFTLKDSDNLAVLSLNIQSLPAKFNELSDMLNELSTNNFTPEVICLQEIWKIIDPSLFQLDNYQTIEINTRDNTRGGGVGIYVKKDIIFNVHT